MNIRRYSSRALSVSLVTSIVGFGMAQLSAEEAPKAKSEHPGTNLLLKAMGALANEDRPEWDQEKAVKIVQSVIAQEKKGEPWNHIAWETDVAKVTAQARKEQKPIFVYLFLKRDFGPKDAAC